MLCWHRWRPWEVEGRTEENDGFARAFGNVLLAKRCEKCGKVKRQGMYQR